MCGRFVPPDEAEIERFWEIGRHNWKSPFAQVRQVRFNLPPQQRNPRNHVPVLRADPDGTIELTDMQWWLLPFWSPEPKIKYATFNARVESVAKSSSFREPFRRRRCLIPAIGWYEWQQRPGEDKQPWFFHAADGSLLAFAGIWDHWKGDGQEIESCSIIVGEPPAAVGHLHDRAPFLMPKERQSAWLNPNLNDAGEVRELLQPPLDGAIAYHPVSRAVGNVRNTGPELIAPIDTNA